MQEKIEWEKFSQKKLLWLKGWGGGGGVILRQAARAVRHVKILFVSKSLEGQYYYISSQGLK